MTPGASKVTSDQGPKPAHTVTAWDRTPGASSTGFSSKKALVLDSLHSSIRRARVRPLCRGRTQRDEDTGQHWRVCSGHVQ